MTKSTWAACLILALSASGVAMADDDCNVAMDQWQPREAVQTMAEARGWKVSRIKIDDGCYQIRGIDENGRSFKAKIDPATLATVKMKRKGHDDDDDDDGAHDRPRRIEPGATSTLPSNQLFTTGKRPTIEVK
jgi:hypothetical protein